MINQIPKHLPPAELEHINVGYMRLSDSAPLVIAQHLGLYQEFGLHVSLHREISWANIRDKTIAGVFDACQMLSPMPLITTLGATGLRVPMITGLVLSLNGDAITVSTSLWQKMQATQTTEHPNSHDALSTAKNLQTALANNPKNSITFATVHSFSNHTVLLRKWLLAGGINPDTDIRIIVLPPEQMIDSLAQGVIDGFCAGAPWNSIAVEYGIGIVATTGFEIWNNAPGKVLAVLESWHARHPATHMRLRLAVMKACQWLEDGHNRELAVDILAGKDYLDLPAHYLRPSLTGQFFHDRKLDPQSHDNFLVFSRYCCGFPWRSQAEILLNEFSTMLGKELDRDKLASLAQQCFRTDLYREAAAKLAIKSPNQDHKTEGAHASPWVLDDGVGQSIELGSDLMLRSDINH
ncbi:MAG: nitrate/nitrite transport system substrate-binding protein [Oceanicoccus sp.]|jgi:nitrate/nitrite transport system substrate-binding protein